MSKRILICDRKSLARIAYRGTLEMHGYEVVGEAISGMEVLKQHQALKPDLVLMSAILAEPGGDGPLIIQKLLETDPDVKVIAYANPRICSKSACDRAGAHGFFVYPARPDEMLATVQSVIG